MSWNAAGRIEVRDGKGERQWILGTETMPLSPWVAVVSDDELDNRYGLFGYFGLRLKADGVSLMLPTVEVPGGPISRRVLQIVGADGPWTVQAERTPAFYHLGVLDNANLNLFYWS